MDLQAIQDVFRAPWPVAVGVVCAIGAVAAWRELERRWASERRRDRLELEHRHKLELELFDASPDKVRAVTDALQKLRSTAEHDRAGSVQRQDVPRDRATGSALPPVDLGDGLDPAGGGNDADGMSGGSDGNSRGNESGGGQ